MEIERVKMELKELKKTVHLIDTLIRTKNEYQYRIKALSESNRIKSKQEINALNEVINKMNIEQYIKRAVQLQNTYTSAINSLGVVDKTILIEYYINGVPAWKIANALGYTEDGIRKRLSKAVCKIAKAI